MSHRVFSHPQVRPDDQPSMDWIMQYPPNPNPTIGFKPPSLGFDLGPGMPMPQPYLGHETLDPYLTAFQIPDIQSQPYSNTVTRPERRLSSCSLPLPPTCFKQTSSCPNSPRRASAPHRPTHSKKTSTIVLKKSPTVVPTHPFNPSRDAEQVKQAMKGFGTDEKTIIRILTKRSNTQRLEIALKFKTLYGKDLIKCLKSELSGNFEKTIMALMTPLRQYYAEELHGAMVGLGTDEEVLIEVLCTLSNAKIRDVSETYYEIYKRSLESDIKGDTSGDFRRLMVSLCSAGRDESTTIDPTSATEDALALYKAGEKRWGTNESTFNMILCERNHAQLRLIFYEYQRLTGHDIEKTIKSEFSGDIQKGFLAIIRSTKNQQAFFARQLYKSMTNLETNDSDLIRLVVTRCEVDMGAIKQEYSACYKQSLGEAIKYNTSGDYKRCLLALIGEW